MTELHYEQLQSEWETLDVKRCELMDLHDADSDTFFENETWYTDYVVIENKQNVLLQQIDRLEELQIKRDAQSTSERLGPDDWGLWKEWALEAGVSKELAELGRSLLRAAFEQHWPEHLQTECGWKEGRDSLIHLALHHPERARIRWQYLLDSGGDFWSSE